MFIYIRLFLESIRFAFNALRENLLRTTLSLLGVTVGIFAIISVLTVVDTLENSIKKSLSFLGSEVIYIEKWPWLFGPNYPWWEYVNRPNPNMKEFEFLDKRMTWAKAAAIFDNKGGVNLKYKSNSIGDVTVMGVSHNYNNVGEIEISEGRFFSNQESSKGKNIAVIGSTIAQELFQGGNAIGKTIKIKGIKFQIIGLLKKQGDNLLNAPSNDDTCIIPFNSMTKIYASKSRGLQPTIAVKGFEEDEGLIELENEIRGLMRNVRGIRPKENDSFALNRPEVFADFLGNIIGVLTTAGWIIGSFSILVGGFGIANIMFVSVKERTNLIGIQKSLGAKNYFILLQFLFESLFLSFLGGVAGLLLVNAISVFSTETFVISLNFKNIVVGITISLIIGIISGIVPAISASRMDPVIAIRSK
ncbi:ABC transporter permease [Flammeovirgaceae bacterium SG7u.111]|nr:ABC transporter permease [Flammeovirgaceae bacterium SG7u.132]WPO35193.1 ABC transporter permease [Flammeovirgaceae bacterium SG7u.111]